jgi:hypothetical protein
VAYNNGRDQGIADPVISHGYHGFDGAAEEARGNILTPILPAKKKKE